MRAESESGLEERDENSMRKNGKTRGAHSAPPWEGYSLVNGGSTQSSSWTIAAKTPWSATAGRGGEWAIKLAPQPASAGHTLTVSTSTGRQQTLRNVAFGGAHPLAAAP